MVGKLLNKLGKTFLDKRFFKYAIIGFSGVTIDFAIYTLLIKFSHISPVVASVISVSIAILNNFLWNTLVNFKKKDHILRRFIKFYLTGCIGLVLTVLIVFIFHDLMGLGPILAKIISIPPVVALQFILNKKFTFGVHKTDYGAIFNSIVLFVTAITLLFLVIITLLFNASLRNNTGHLLYVLLTLLITICISYITVVFHKKKVSLSPKVVSAIRNGTTVYVFLLGIFIISGISDNLSLLPGGDQAILFNGSSPEWLRSSDWYLQNFPYQAGLALLFRASNILFGVTLLPILFLNLIAICITFYLLNKISQKLFNNGLISSIVSLLLILVFPVFFMMTMIYGDMIGIALAFSGIYSYLNYRELKYTQKHHKQALKYLFLVAILFSFMLIIKSSLLLIPVSIFIYDLIEHLSTQTTIKKRFLQIFLVLITLVVTPYVVQTLFTKVYFNHYNITSEKSIPKIAWVAMGLQPSMSSNFNDLKKTSEKTQLNYPGAHNMYITWLFADKFPINSTGDSRTKEISDLSYRHIIASLNTFDSSPLYAIEFLSKKNAILWSDSSYGSIFQLNRDDGSIPSYTIVSSGIKVSQSEDLLSRLIQLSIDSHASYYIRSIIQSLVYIFSFIAVLSTLLLKRLQKNTSWFVLLYIFVCGFMFYCLWEASARYTLIYYLLLLPIAAYGITAVPYLLKTLKRRKFRTVIYR